jgi:hypothetical protein
MSVVFAASHPERISALMLYGGDVRMLWAPDYPLGYTEREYRKMTEENLPYRARYRAAVSSLRKRATCRAGYRAACELIAGHLTSGALHDRHTRALEAGRLSLRLGTAAAWTS